MQSDIMNYCICVSGNLGLVVLNNLLQKPINIAAVLTDKHSDEIITKCESRGVKCFAGNPRNGKAYSWIKENEIEFDILLSINYLFILESDILNQPKHAINFHGSLLPRYRGRTPHVWAIINGEKEVGITAHLMNDKCDDGDIVKQVIIPVEDEDTGAKILTKYNETYPSMVDEIIDDIESSNVVARPQDISKATYFGKRTPEDGQINWQWQKERIRNWVRAQANPYPGSFTFCKGQKIVINRIEYSDHGFQDTIINGTVIDIIDNTPYVKVQNGVVKLTNYITDYKLEINDILNNEGII